MYLNQITTSYSPFSHNSFNQVIVHLTMLVAGALFFVHCRALKVQGQNDQGKLDCG